ncbi:hypothetical protein AT15_01210 [Kosmotoga arenicorallina S304]|uniref:Methyltransferase type 11 domain-containing protein n=1 Tax=Kosmotoga arenicorallina S304 TaxID=1453497 RepID=A0A176K0L4_9BACT|nr:hypothetical protein [Kosmotoga arenicorallina]OAA29924.1 hypothetical protein AT15_01210 [Kosmotoga arenicorallina S304]
MNSSWRKQYLEDPPGPMAKAYSKLFYDETLKDYLIHFAAALDDNAMILDFDCSGCSFWKYLRECGIKVIGISGNKCKSIKLSDRGIKVLHMPFNEISFIGIFGGFLLLYVPNYLPPDTNLEILHKAHLALRIGGKGLIALEIEDSHSASTAALKELSKKYPVLEGERIINEKYRFIPTLNSVKNLIRLSEFHLMKYSVKAGKAFFLVRK